VQFDEVEDVSVTRVFQKDHNSVCWLWT